jgi:hypothetical protein
MAKVTIVVTDDPIDGSVSFETTPPMGELLERKKQHGATSLSTAEVYAVIALNHMLTHAKSQVKENRGRIITPGMDN